MQSLFNETDLNAPQYLYSEIPHEFVFTKGNWPVRKRGAGNVVARMYTVGVKDEERFYLRFLLLHVCRATCFESLKTLNNIVLKVQLWQEPYLSLMTNGIPA